MQLFPPIVHFKYLYDHLLLNNLPHPPSNLPSLQVLLVNFTLYFYPLLIIPHNTDSSSQTSFQRQFSATLTTFAICMLTTYVFLKKVIRDTELLSSVNFLLEIEHMGFWVFS